MLPIHIVTVNLTVKCTPTDLVYSLHVTVSLLLYQSIKRKTKCLRTLQADLCQLHLNKLKQLFMLETCLSGCSSTLYYAGDGIFLCVPQNEMTGYEITIFINVMMIFYSHLALS